MLKWSIPWVFNFQSSSFKGFQADFYCHILIKLVKKVHLDKAASFNLYPLLSHLQYCFFTLQCITVIARQNSVICQGFSLELIYCRCCNRPYHLSSNIATYSKKYFSQVLSNSESNHPCTHQWLFTFFFSKISEY